MQFLPGGAIKVAGAHLQIASNLLKPKNIQNLILDTLERYVFFFFIRYDTDTIFGFFSRYDTIFWPQKRPSFDIFLGPKMGTFGQK